MAKRSKPLQDLWDPRSGRDPGLRTLLANGLDISDEAKASEQQDTVLLGHQPQQGLIDQIFENPDDVRDALSTTLTQINSRPHFLTSVPPSDAQEVDIDAPSHASTSGYRLEWSARLARTPLDIAQEIRGAWKPARKTLKKRPDPRLIAFLKGFTGTESAIDTLTSNISPESKLILLQGLLDPSGQIQFRDKTIDSQTLTDQILSADAGSTECLEWLEGIRNSDALKLLAELKGSDVLAEADFRLTKWHKQADHLIRTLTRKSDEFLPSPDPMRIWVGLAELSLILWWVESSQVQKELDSGHDERRSRSRRALQQVESMYSNRTKIDIAAREDWFLEEAELYLRSQFAHSLPAQLALALAPGDVQQQAASLLERHVRHLAASTSLDPADYPATIRGCKPGEPVDRNQVSTVSGGSLPRERTERMLRAARHTIAAVESAHSDDIGTLLSAREVLRFLDRRRQAAHDVAVMTGSEKHIAESLRRQLDAMDRAESYSPLVRAATIDAAAERFRQEIRDQQEMMRRSPTCLATKVNFFESQLAAANVNQNEAQSREEAATAWLATATERKQEVEVTLNGTSNPHVRAGLDTALRLITQECKSAQNEQRSARSRYERSAGQINRIQQLRDELDEQLQPLLEESKKRAIALEQERIRAVEAEQKRAEARRLEAEDQRRRQAKAQAQEWERTQDAKGKIPPLIDQLLALKPSPPLWRRRAWTEAQASILERIDALQSHICNPPTNMLGGHDFPTMALAPGERYVGTVTKLTDYGAFIALPAAKDGLVRDHEAKSLLARHQRVVVEIVEIRPLKPISLKLLRTFEQGQH